MSDVRPLADKGFLSSLAQDFIEEVIEFRSMFA